MAGRKKTPHVPTPPLSREEIRKAISEGKKFTEIARDYNADNLINYRAEKLAWSQEIPKSVFLEEALRAAFRLLQGWYSSDRNRLTLELIAAETERSEQLDAIKEVGMDAAMKIFEDTKGYEQRRADFKEFLDTEIFHKDAARNLFILLAG